MAYEPHHNPTYPAWKDMPDKTTPAMASTFQGYDNILKDIEAELARNYETFAIAEETGQSLDAYVDEEINKLRIILKTKIGSVYQPISTVEVDGLVTEAFRIAGIDMRDDIAAEELIAALGLSGVAASGNYDDLENRLIPDGTSITKDKDGTIHATGGGEGAGIVDITQADYDAMTDEEKQDGTVYHITDAPEVVSDEYAADRQYTKGDYCIYKNGLYRCLKDTTGEWEASAWELTTLAEEIKTNGSNLQGLEERLSGYLADTLAIKDALNDLQEGAVEYQHCSDLDNVPKTGPYRSNGTNAPKGVQSHVYAFKWTEDLQFQIGVPLSEKKIYSRLKCNGPWTEWTPAGSYAYGNLDFEWVTKEDGYGYLRFTIQGNTVIDIPFGTFMEPRRMLTFSSVDASKYSASLFTLTGGIFIMELNCSLVGTYPAWQEIPVGQFASYDLGEQSSLGVAVSCGNSPIALRVDIKSDGTVILAPYADLSLPGGTIFYGRFVRVYK